MAPRQARRVALGRLGGGEVVNDKWRDGRCFAAADDLRRDVLYAVRGLRRSPVFTWIAIASLALGIGANTALFSFVNAILLQRLPVSEPHRLVTFAETYPGESAAAVWNLGTVRALAEQDAALDGVFGWFSRPVSLSMGDSGRWVNGELVTGQYYRTLRVSPAVGRLLNEDDVRNAGADPVCVLSYGLWQRDFGGDPGVIGQSVLLNGRGYRVIGVTARGFHGAELHRRFDVGLPATRIGDFLPAFGGPEDGERMNTMSWLVAMGRLGTGIARTEAERYAELALQETNPERQAQLRLEDGGQGFNTIRPAFGRPVLVLMGIVTLVLLVACANLGSSLLARAQARYRELAVRSALGASRARLVRQLLVETFVIAGVGGLGGIVLSFWMRDSLVAVLNAGRLATAAVHVTVDVSVLAFAILLTCAVASVHTLDVDVGAGISSERLLGYLSTLFAALTLVLAGIGLYGVLAASIVRRTREIGLRSALGARRRDLVVLFGRESATLVVVGVTVGGVLALASAPALSSVLFGVGATDPVTLIGSIGVLAVVALLATAIPLWRAARVDPMVALRQE